jgi:hypothetical protein
VRLLRMRRVQNDHEGSMVGSYEKMIKFGLTTFI